VTGLAAVQSPYAYPAMFFLILTSIAILGDRLHARRRERAPEKVGLIPWPLVTVLSLLPAMVFLAFWLKGE
jgi:hypothetical protein